MRCARCGYRFAGSTRRRKGYEYPEYVCCGYSGSGAAFCPRFAVPKDVLEGLVLEEVDRRWRVSLGVEAILARVEAEIERKLAPATPQDPQEIKRKLAAIDERMLAIVHNLSAEHADVANAALAQLKASRAALQRELAASDGASDMAEEAAAATPVIAALIARLVEILKRGAVPDQKTVLRAFVKEVIVRPDELAVEVIFWHLPRLSECRFTVAHDSLEFQQALQVAAPVETVDCPSVRRVRLLPK